MTTATGPLARVQSGAGIGEARQIEITRVLCIFLMMYVHVPPGVDVAPSAVNTGAIAPFGMFIGDVLSRASVAALSFISGYLLWTYNRDKAVGALVVSKLRALILPMAVWGVIYLLLAAVKVRATGEAYGYAALSDPLGVLNDIFGLTRQTANLSLFFIRDLFVSLLLIRLAAPILRGPAGVAVLVVVLAASLLGNLAPLIVRANILIFATGGSVWAANGLRLSDASRPAIALPVVAIAGFAAWAMMQTELNAGRLDGAQNLLERLSLTFAVIFVAGLLAASGPGRGIARLGRHMFLTYLSHMPMIAIFWFFWQRLAGGPMAPSYVLFFFFCPVVAMVLGCTLDRLVDYLPKGVQLCLRGKVRQPTARTPT